jgi:hypothetical protein
MNWKILLFALLIIGCERNPKETYYVDLNRETFGNININLRDQSDTILLLQETSFSYNVKLQEGQILHNIDFTVDGELISSTDLPDYVFGLQPDDYETGTHILKAEVTTTTGTGSMSDVFGKESLLYTRQWTILVDHTPPEDLIITSITEFNGKLKIEWTKSTSLNFKNYQVFRDLYNTITHSPNFMNLAMITNRDSNSYIDDSYVGGPVSYHISNSSIKTTTPGISRSYEGSYPKFLSAEKTGADKVKFTWNKTRYPGNFGKYEITVRDKINLTFTTLFSATNVNDTAYTAALNFGDTIDCWLNTVPEKLDSWYPETVSDRKSVYIGEKIPEHRSRLVHSNDPDIIFLVDNYSISRFNLKTGETELTLRTRYNDWEYRNVFLSPDGRYLVRISGNVAELLDPVTLTVIRSIDLAPFFDNSDHLRIVNVTSNGWMSVYRYEWPFSAGIVNLESGDTLFTMKGLNQIRIDASPSGKYMIVTDAWISTLYNYNGSLIKLHTLSQDDFEFNPVNEEELYKFSPSHGNSISLLNCSDLHVVKSYKPFIALGFHDIDPISGLIMIGGDSETYFFDLDQKSLVATIKLASYYYISGYAFFNNTLFSALGYKISIK